MMRQTETIEPLYLNPDDWSPLILDAYKGDLDSCPEVLADYSFVPFWIPGASREVFVAAYNAIECEVKQLVSYRMNLPVDSWKTLCTTLTLVRPREEGRHYILSPQDGGYRSPLTLVNKTVAPALRLPWLPHTLSNRGHMISVKAKANCFSLFIDAKQPVNTLDLDEDIIPNGVEKEPTMMSVDPWSDAIVVATPGRIRVFYLE